MNILFEDFGIVTAVAVAAAFALFGARHQLQSLLQAGISLQNSGRYFEAERVLVRGSNPGFGLALVADPALVTHVRLQLCWVWIQEGQEESAVKAIAEMRQGAARKAPAELTLISMLELMAWLELRNGRRKDASAFLDRAINYCQRNSEPSKAFMHASVLYTRGWLYVVESDLVSARSFMQQSQSALMTAVGAQGMQHLPVLMTSAWIELLQSNGVAANTMLAHALRTYGPLLGRWHPRIAHLLALLGACAALDDDWLGANEYLQTAEQILRARGLMQTMPGQKVTTALEFVANILRQ